MVDVQRMTDKLIEGTWRDMCVSTRNRSSWVEAPAMHSAYLDGNGEWVERD
jgi:hypothetical protein